MNHLGLRLILRERTHVPVIICLCPNPPKIASPSRQSSLNLFPHDYMLQEWSGDWSSLMQMGNTSLRSTWIREKPIMTLLSWKCTWHQTMLSAGTAKSLTMGIRFRLSWSQNQVCSNRVSIFPAQSKTSFYGFYWCINVQGVLFMKQLIREATLPSVQLGGWSSLILAANGNFAPDFKESRWKSCALIIAQNWTFFLRTC